MPEITIDVPYDWQNEKPTISVDGVQGSSCKDLTKPFEQALGEVESDTPTDEMYKAKIEAQNKAVVGRR